MLNNLKINFFKLVLFFSKMIIANKVRSLMLSLLNFIDSDKVKARFKNKISLKQEDILKIAFFTGITFTHINKHVIENPLTRLLTI